MFKSKSNHSEKTLKFRPGQQANGATRAGNRPKQFPQTNCRNLKKGGYVQWWFFGQQIHILTSVNRIFLPPSSVLSAFLMQSSMSSRLSNSTDLANHKIITSIQIHVNNISQLHYVFLLFIHLYKRLGYFLALYILYYWYALASII